VQSSNDLYPRSFWACNLAVQSSNDLYPKSIWGCNLAVTSSNDLYPQALWASNTAWWGCNTAVEALGTAQATSNVAFAPSQSAAVLTIQPLAASSNQAPRISMCNVLPTTSVLSLSVQPALHQGGVGGRCDVAATRVGGAAGGGGDLVLSAEGSAILRAGDGGSYAQIPAASQAAQWAWPASNTNASMEWPPGGLANTLASTTLASLMGTEAVLLGNVPYGAGSYLASASSIALTNAQLPLSPLAAFSRSNLLGIGASNAAWASLPGYTSVTGWAFQPAVGAARAVPSTTVDGFSRAGDWLQLDLPEAIVPTSYVVAPAINAIDGQPQRFVLAAGPTPAGPWTSLDATYATQDYAPANAVISITPSAYSTSANTMGASNGVGGFTSVRLIVLRVAVSATPPAALLPVVACGVQLFARATTSSLGFTKRAAVCTGSLGLGTAAPTQRLDVRGSASVSSNVGIGVTAPTFQLHLSRDSAAKPASSMWTVLSDARLKADVQRADLERCYAIVRDTPLCRFGWKAGVMPAGAVTDLKRLGWIAQDVERAFPKAVGKRAMHGLPDCRSLDTDQLLAALYGAVQRLQQLVEER
jgi:hypothetical protein